MFQAEANDTMNPRLSRDSTMGDLNEADITYLKDEPRMVDLRLAVALGFARPSNIRRIIKRHEPALVRLGEVYSTVEKTLNLNDNVGGRPGRVYYLNKKQALFICTKSETANATDATIRMVEVFDAYLAGRSREPHPASTIPVKAHKRRTSTHLDAAYRLARTADRLEAVAARLAPIHASVAFIDGAHIQYDADDYQIHNAEAVVIRQDGTWAVEVVEWRGGDRTGYGPCRYGAYGRPERETVTILGRVLRPVVAPTFALPTAPTRGPRPVYRDAILAALAQGCTARQAAQMTGASIHTVRDWQRRRQHVAAIAA